VTFKYYSAKLLVVCLVDDGTPRQRNTCDCQHVVVRARDYEDAFARALAIGKREETRYKNAKGRWVRWALVEIQSLKCLGRSIDGQEVGSFLHERRFDRPVPFKRRFNPKRSRVLYE
jgi:hypothetical protein